MRFAGIRGLKLAALLSGAVYAPGALAQATGADATTVQDAGQRANLPAVDTNTPAQDKSTHDGQIGDIVVTAQRREQRLQDVPISVSAISSTELISAGATGTSALQVAVPSLVVQRQLNGALPFLRGIGFSVGDANAENSVAVYLDGVYQPTPAANFFDFSNIERVEVLKGPQGTLFGRNSTGGVIQVVTKTPTQTPEMNFSVGYENYQRVTASAYVAGGLTSTIAGSLSLLYANQNKGWGTNITTGQEIFLGRDFGARVKLIAALGDTTTATLAGDYSESRSSGVSGQPPQGAANIAGQDYPGRYIALGDTTDQSFTRNRGVSLTVEHEGAVVLKSISAYRKFDGELLIDQDLSPIPLIAANFSQRTELITQEVHIASLAEAKFQWLIGGYYFNYKAGQLPLTLRGLAFAPFSGIEQFGVTHAKSYSIFGQATYPLGERTNLTIGGRYTWDRSRFTGSVLAADIGLVLEPESSRNLSYEKPTWRVALDHKITPDVMVYASYNRGVKSGNFSVSTVPSLQKAYLPEQLDAFELGVKSELFDRRVIFNTAAFYYDFKNIQFQRISGGIVTVFNGPTAQLYGAEVEITARVTPQLTINANGGYLHTRIGDFPGAPNSIRIPTGQTVPGPANFNAEGNNLPNAPGFSGNAGFDYRLPTSSGHFNVASNLYYTDSYFSEPDNRLSVQSHILLNASFGWTGDNGLRASVWAKNLTNVYYYAQLAGQAGLSDLGSPAAPRTYGITLGYSFK